MKCNVCGVNFCKDVLKAESKGDKEEVKKLKAEFCGGCEINPIKKIVGVHEFGECQIEE